MFDIYSKRKKKMVEDGKTILNKYDEIPRTLRVQVSCIWRDAIGPFGYSGTGIGRSPYPSNKYWADVRNTLCCEYGKTTLVDTGDDYADECYKILLDQKDIDQVLDIIEYTFIFIDTEIRKLTPILKRSHNIKLSPDEAIDELNKRFLEHHVGYQYIEGKIVRMDSEYMHQEVHMNTVHLLNTNQYKGALEEFIDAHNHFKKGQYKDTMVDALKSFESTMKAICQENKWEEPDSKNCKKLIQVCFDNGLIPPDLKSEFNSLRTTLESGLPTVRNKNGGHGQGKNTVKVPDYLARYALNLAGTNIILLMEANHSKS